MITAVRLPIDWNRYGLPTPWQAGRVHLCQGSRAWSWQPETPDLGLRHAGEPPIASTVEGWGIDHVVLLVPDLEAGMVAVRHAGHEPSRVDEVKGRPTAFFMVGTLLEMVEEASVDQALLFGVALEAWEPLESVAARWRAQGIAVSGPRPALQEGRSILTVTDAGAGLAVMTPRERAGP